MECMRHAITFRSTTEELTGQLPAKKRKVRLRLIGPNRAGQRRPASVGGQEEVVEQLQERISEVRSRCCLECKSQLLPAPHTYIHR